MTSPGEGRPRPWVEDDETEAVRPYAVTGGRTTPSVPVDLMALVRATGSVPEHHLDPDQLYAVHACAREPRTVAELAATLRRPVQVTKILISDLIGLGAVRMRTPVAAIGGHTHERLLEKLLDGLENL
ncbi:DUF742 domain-containing protein [Cryptosporangium arvum]|uniref:DUF742 domain-containing protein n=1 Tax=Cryptosporangium arvum TaxID=80871 RepID=UPI0004BACCF9|nr:DUF742 domain-containing protein [Cryptosporangium arvum]